MYSKLIILYFRQYASGNFLANILCHNSNFVPKFVFDPYVPRYYSDVLSLTDKELYSKQLELLDTTIPESTDQCQEWWKYELGCAAFWAKDVDTYRTWDPAVWGNNLKSQPFDLMNRGKYCFIVAHNLKQYRCINQCLPGATTIELTNCQRTVQSGQRLKIPAETLKLMSPPFEPFRPIENSIKFDIDTLWDKEDFFNSVQHLLNMFDIEDKTLDSKAREYYNRYITLYKKELA